MPQNDFLPFATGAGANVENQASYAADPSTAAGFAAGIAQSQKLNKVWRQSSFVAAGVAQFIMNQAGIDVLDDGDLTGFVTKLTEALLDLNPREVLQQATTYYVNNTTGSDTFDGLTSTTAWKTLQQAATYLMSKIDANGRLITVQVADGSYAGFALTAPILGTEFGIPVTFQGNVANPGNCQLTGPPIAPPGIDPLGFPTGATVICSNLARLNIQGFRILNNSGNGHGAATGLFGRLRFQNIDFGTIVSQTAVITPGFGIPVFAHIWCSSWARVRSLQNYSISGPAYWHVECDTYGNFLNTPSSSSTPNTITITGNPAFGGAFCWATEYGEIDWTGGVVAPMLPVFVGSATGSRYHADHYGSILTSAQPVTFLPGNAAGSIDSATYGLYS